MVQTVSGEEQTVKEHIDKRLGSIQPIRCFIPLCEEVRRRSDRYNIVFRRLFPGYLFIETENPEAAYSFLRSVPHFTRVLGSKEQDGNYLFIPVSEDDQAFLESILEDGMLHVSYAHLSKSNRIDKVAGPLAGYRNHIIKLEFRRRTALVDAWMFGKRRKLAFGLWTDGDPEVAWLSERIGEGNTQTAALDEGVEIDIGIHPGDKVIDLTGVYTDMELVVTEVDAKHRRVYSQLKLMGGNVRVMLNADNVEKV
ncbi:MAG: hypothetical protein IJU50_01165 [Lachnospiraceae bacterium]|nr:hypothetical protein [Lachnospiraceae bacterium]